MHTHARARAHTHTKQKLLLKWNFISYLCCKLHRHNLFSSQIEYWIAICIFCFLRLYLYRQLSSLFITLMILLSKSEVKVYAHSKWNDNICLTFWWWQWWWQCKQGLILELSLFCFCIVFQFLNNMYSSPLTRFKELYGMHQHGATSRSAPSRRPVGRLNPLKTTEINVIRLCIHCP